jgi:hypothetical protein
VRKRLAILRDHVQRLDEDIDRERTLRGAAIERLRRDVAIEHDRLRETAPQVAISGPPLEVTGVFFVVVRTVLQGVAQVIQWVSEAPTGQARYGMSRDVWRPSSAGIGSSVLLRRRRNLLEH